MLDIQEADQLMKDLIDLKKRFKDSNSIKDKLILQNHENLCVEKFKYLVTMKTSKYKTFSNYEDLNQEGLEALLKSMNNYNPKLGCFFWWAHKYIDTRISRSANLHTTIRYPLKVAKNNTPHKEAIMPTLIEERYCPDKELETSQTSRAIHGALSSLDNQQEEIIKLTYGFNGDKPMSINKVCKKLNISRSVCIKTINSALSIMKDNIKI